MSAPLPANENSGPRDVVVLKFGGTSVEDANAFRRAARIVHSRLPAKPVVVVSALARVTDQLLSAAQAAAEGKLDYSNAVLTSIRLRHQEIAAELLEGNAVAILDQQLEPEFRQLNSAVCETAVSGGLTPVAQDAILSFGERLSSKLATAILQSSGLDAVHLDSAAAIVTDSRHTRATPLWDRTYEMLARTLGPLLEAGKIPVLGGFIASTAEGVPSTLGRGGSDLTAAIVGAALHASRVEIWTDVDGIMTADPNVCADAQRIAQISFDDAAELAYFGAKVLHHATLGPAARAKIPVHVLNSRKPESPGTEIVPRVNSPGSIRAITAKRGVAAVEVEFSSHLDAEQLRNVFAAFDRHHCPVDLMSVSSGRSSFLVGATAALPNVASELKDVAHFTWENHKALVCLVGDNLRRQPEVASRIFAAVSDMDVRVFCQGPSDRSLTFLVEESRADESVRRLHSLFFSNKKAPASSKTNSVALCQAGESWL